MSSPAEPVGTIDVALAHTSRLLQSDPKLAAEQAAEILRVVPRHPVATLLLGCARRCTGQTDLALQVLEQLTREQPSSAAAHYELALAQIQAGQLAIAALERAVALKPNMPDAWRTLGDQLTIAGELQRADAAYAQHLRASTQDPRLMTAASALVDGRIAVAEQLLKAHLTQYPTDVAAIRMLAEVAARLGRNADAEVLLERCLQLAPSFAAARNQYAIILHRQNKYAAALTQIDLLLKAEPHNSAYANTRAVVLGKIGEYEESLQLYGRILAANPQHEKIWLSYGHALSTAGRREDSIAAYRRSIAVRPEMGEAYWSLANLKTFRFEPPDVASMRHQLQRKDLTQHDRLHFHFALGKALEDAGEFAESFEHYRDANQLRRATVNYDSQETTAFVERSEALFDRQFFESRSHYGCPAPDPIFIVGLPRAGSTLLEQILSSHSCVEGTMELPDIIGIAAQLTGQPLRGSGERPYPGVLASLSAASCRELGERYLAQTRIQRKTGKAGAPRPFFIDKMPNNFLHIGLIQLILPNAKIIDARRHPLDCCFSAFKMQFADGHRYSYDLGEIGRYYRDYVRYMQHIDRVLPARVHRVIYENVVADTEGEVLRLLTYCGLPFEAACLKFYENARPVRTASAQQVRTPIFKEGMNRWRAYEQWLDPLKSALGDVLDAYPREVSVP